MHWPIRLQLLHGTCWICIYHVHYLGDVRRNITWSTRGLWCKLAAREEDVNLSEEQEDATLVHNVTGEQEMCDAQEVFVWHCQWRKRRVWVSWKWLSVMQLLVAFLLYCWRCGGDSAEVRELFVSCLRWVIVSVLRTLHWGDSWCCHQVPQMQVWQTKVLWNRTSVSIVHWDWEPKTLCWRERGTHCHLIGQCIWVRTYCNLIGQCIMVTHGL